MLLNLSTRLLRVPWTAMRPNQSILKETNPKYSLEGLMLKLQYFGHLMQRADLLEETLILGKTEGRRRRPSSLSSRLLPGLPQAQLQYFTSCLHNSLGGRHSHVEGKPQNLGQGDPAARKNVFQRDSALIGPNSPDPLFILDVRVLDRMSSRTDCAEGNEEVSYCNTCWRWG